MNVTLTHCFDTHITDAGMAHLGTLTNLVFLDIGGTEVSDEGLHHMAGLTKLEQLDLSSTQVTSAGLVHVKSLPELRAYPNTEHAPTCLRMNDISWLIHSLHGGVKHVYETEPFRMASSG